MCQSDHPKDNRPRFTPEAHISFVSFFFFCLVLSINKIYAPGTIKAQAYETIDGSVEAFTQPI